MAEKETKTKMTADLKRCVKFHGHICPGLVYGYRVAKEAVKLMKLKRSRDEEVVAVCENDSCAVDSLQVLLGTSAGKGNLIIRDYGKNVYTVFSRICNQAYRFSRRTEYDYKGKNKKIFANLNAALNLGTASERERRRLKSMKIDDLLNRPFAEIFAIERIPFTEPRHAEVAPSKLCAICGEMTMASRMMKMKGRGLVCRPCFQKIP